VILKYHLTVLISETRRISNIARKLY